MKIVENIGLILLTLKGFEVYLKGSYSRDKVLR
jgi:hypothetical protein